MGRKLKAKEKNRRKQILGTLLFILAALMLVSLITHSGQDDARITNQVESHLSPFDIQYHNQGGMMGAYLALVLLHLVGWLAYFLPFGLILTSFKLFSSELAAKTRKMGLVLLSISALGTLLFNIHFIVEKSLGSDSGAAGGYFGEKLSILVVKLLGETGSYIVLGGAVALLLISFTNLTSLLTWRPSLPGGEQFQTLVQNMRSGLVWFFSFSWFPTWSRDRAVEDEKYPPEADEDLEQFDASLEANEPLLGDSQTELAGLGSQSESKPPKGVKSKTAKLAAPINIKSFQYEYPGLEILSENPSPGPSVQREELEMTARMLRETLDTFGVRIQGEIEWFPGPIITRYEFKPAAGIKVNQILNLSDDLALALRAKRIRIVAPIPGKAAVGVEIPNRQHKSVFLRDIVSSQEFRNEKLILPLALGVTTSGQPFVADLAKMPHLLIAGATGSGKSVCMNVLITSLVYRLHPLHCRFIFIDPKMLELSVYAGIPHLGRPVVTLPRQAEKVLTDAVGEMEARYRKLANAGVRNIEDYNSRETEEDQKLPYIIIFVDELADLMMSSSSSKMEMLITRLAQMARAVGIHLVLATQRPSVDVITGLIKANFPARIAFQVSSKVDSRTIIDANGAEKLLGAGDMLYLPSGLPESIRLHGAYVSNEETTELVDFINGQGLEMLTLKTISQKSGEASDNNDVDLGDPLFKEACEVCLRHKQGSVSLLQRRLGIGYQRAARLIDRLEQAGIVSPFDGSKAREVIVDRAYVETLFAGTAQSESETTEAN